VADISLVDLAKAAGIAVEYEDARGEIKAIEPAHLEAILERLDLPTGDDRARAESLARLKGRASGDVLPPLLTADEGRPIRVPGQRRGRVEILLEDGGRVEGEIVRRRGVSFAPAVAEIGYHRLRVGGEETVVAVAPLQCHWPEGDTARPFGVTVQVHALRRPGDGGIGDFTGVAELAEAAARHGADALAVSPVHAMFAADPGRASPYSPSNRLHLNGLLADPASRFGTEAVGRAAEELGLAERRDAWERADLIDWAGAGGAKLALMRRLFDGLDPASETARAFEAWRRGAGAGGLDHAVFEALQHRLRDAEGRPQHWRDWPEAYAAPDAPGVREVATKDVAFHHFLQWLAEDGLEAAQARARAAGMSIGLIADLAVGVDGGGSQGWSSRGDLLVGLHMGAPPDIYNAKGQDWGLAALDPHALRASGFRAFLEMLRASLAWAGGVRIDHILGLHRVWVVPEGAPPTDGAYLHFPMEDLLRLVCLESRRHGAIVIGEDLGTVPGGLRRELARRRILGMSVLWFEQEEGRFLAPRRWRADTAAMTTTHDLPTVAGWWAGRDLDWKERLDLYPDEETQRGAREERDEARTALWRALRRAKLVEGHAPDPRPEAAPVDAALGFVARSASRLALVPIEDLAGEVEQPNLPGTVDEHPNWRRRLPETARTCEDEIVRGRLAAFREGREQGVN
jgi:4-alpha-glucanotransferase